MVLDVTMYAVTESLCAGSFKVYKSCQFLFADFANIPSIPCCQIASLRANEQPKR